MSFSSEVKEELIRVVNTARHCQIAEITAIISLCGRVQISEFDEYKLLVHTENAGVARKYYSLSLKGKRAAEEQIEEGRKFCHAVTLLLSPCEA